MESTRIKMYARRVCLLGIALLLVLSGTVGALASEREMEGNLYLEGLPIVEEPMTFDVAMVKVSIDRTDSNDKQILKDFAEATNVQINWIDIPDTAWTEKINIMIAGGTLPDMIIPERGSFDIITNSAMLTPLNDLIPKYAPNINAHLEENPNLRALITTPDGTIYSLPGGDPAPWLLLGENAWVNQTWLDILGLSMPETLDDLYEVALAFKTQDPNGNGQADEIPILFSQSTSSQGQLSGFISSFGIADYAHHIAIRDGKAMFVPADPAYYEGLKFLHKLSSEGLLDPEGLTQNAQQTAAKGQSDPQIAGFVLDFYAPNVVGTAYEKDYVVVPPLKGPDGQDPVVRGFDVAAQFRPAGYLITRKCENPEVLVRWIDAAFADKLTGFAWSNGVENDIWQFMDDGIHWTLTEKHMNNDRPGFASGEDYRFSTYVPYMSMDLWNWTDTRDLSDSPVLEMKVESVNAFRPYSDPEFIPVGFWDEAAQNERTIMETDIENYMMMFFAKSVRDGIDDAGWAEHLAALEMLNIDRYVELYQGFYDANMK